MDLRIVNVGVSIDEQNCLRDARSR